MRSCGQLKSASSSSRQRIGVDYLIVAMRAAARRKMRVFILFVCLFLVVRCEICSSGRRGSPRNKMERYVDEIPKKVFVRDVFAIYFRLCVRSEFERHVAPRASCFRAGGIPVASMAFPLPRSSPSSLMDVSDRVPSSWYGFNWTLKCLFWALFCPSSRWLLSTADS